MTGMLIAGERTEGAAGEGDRRRRSRHRRDDRDRPARDRRGRRRRRRGRRTRRSATWQKTDAEDRAILLRKAIALIERDRKALTESLVHEQGKPVTEAGGEIHHLIHGLNYYADLATKVRGTHHAAAERAVARPTAWSCAARWASSRRSSRTTSRSRCSAPSSRPALMAGNTIVVKPAATTPLTTLKIADLLLEAGVPARRGERDHRPRLRGRRRARHPRQGPPRRLHRLDRGRPPHHGPGRAEAEAHDDGARRQRPGDRRPRRQHQGRRARHRHRPLLELRPDVPRRQAHLRLRRGLRRADGAAHAHRRQVRARPRLGEGREAEHPRRPAAHRRRPRRAHASSSRTRSTAAASWCSAATSPTARAIS